MSNDLFIVPRNKRPDWLEYPQPFYRLVDQKLFNIKPWHIMKAESVLIRAQGLAKRYPERELFPFAYRQDNDEVACWAKGAGERVFIIHDFASSGWENEAEFEDLWSWFRSAIDETIKWD